MAQSVSFVARPVPSRASDRISARRPSTCAGPTQAAAATASPAPSPWAAKTGSMKLISIQWFKFSSENSPARRQKFPSRSTVLPAEAAGAPCRPSAGPCERVRAPIRCSGRTTRPATATATQTVPCQPSAWVSTAAAGKASVEASPATSVTCVIAARAASPNRRISRAKHTSYRHIACAMPSPAQASM